MANTRIFVISYDVADNKRRRKLVKLLETFGRRVQYSVFEAYLNKRQVEHILRDAEKIINIKDKDSIRIYSICSACYKEGVYVGGKGAIDWRGPVIV